MCTKVTQTSAALPIRFDPEKHRLGSLCKCKHEYLNTGKSLRYKSTNQCFICMRLKSPGKGIPFVSALEKRLQDHEGMVAYLGDICRHGHDFEGTGCSLRYVKCNICVTCSNQASQRGYRKNRDSVIARTSLWGKLNRESRKRSARKYLQTQNGKEKTRHKQRMRKALKRSTVNTKISVEETFQRKSVFGFKCAYCGRTATPDKLQMDHFISLKRGGSHVLSNLVPACNSCNPSKYDHDPLEWYRKQTFFSLKRWRFILKVLGKNESNYQQIPFL